MKNVLIIRNAYSYDFGGGERFPVFLAQQLAHDGYTPTIISRSPHVLTFASKNSIPVRRGWWWSFQNWNGIFALLFPVYLLWQCGLITYYFVLIKRTRPIVVHVQSRDDCIAATIAAHVCHVGVIWTDHADLKHVWRHVEMPWRNPVGKLVLIAARWADAITVVSDSERALVIRHLTHHASIVKKISVIYNGAYDSYVARPAAEQSVVTIGSMCRLVRDKGIVELIAAYRRLHATYPDTRLLLIGDGPDRATFEQQASDDSTIEFAGHQDEPLALLAAVDIFVHATYHEGFSLSLVEAAMMQKAIIATNVGGNPEIIAHQKNGLLVPAQNESALYDALKLLVDDDVLRQTLAAAARDSYLKSFQFDTIVTTKFIPLYEKISTR